MKNTMNSGVVALALSTGLLVGCTQESTTQKGVQKVGEEVCTRYLNLLSTNPKDPNSHLIHLKGLIYPVIADCGTTVQSSASTNAKIKYSRSASLVNPTSGKVQASTVDIGKKQIADFAQSINHKPEIGEHVKPFFVSKTKPTITITNGSIIGNASAEGRKDGGDKSLLEDNAVGNKQIAHERADNIKDRLIQAIEDTGAEVKGRDKVNIATKINPLNSDELGKLYAEGLVMNGNGANVVMNRIAQYNTGTLATPSLNTIIGEKRFAEASISYTATGVDRIVDTSKWNYAYWLGLLAVVGYTGGRLVTKRSSRKQ